MAAADIALAHYRRQVALAQRVAARLGGAWGKIDATRIAESWTRLLPIAVAMVTEAQLEAASQADGYLTGLVSEFGLAEGADGVVNARALAGIASDGRDLVSLLYQPAINALTAIKSGASPERALAMGRLHLDMIARTQVADAGRAADGVSLVAHKQFPGYVRVLSPPSCSRCVILAGKRYKWNTGFSRHPRCDCRHLPSPLGPDDGRTDPLAYFRGLSREEQDRAFTASGAQAIREGGDINRVVNSRRGMYTAGGRRFTHEAADRGRRLMPEQIYREAKGDRDEAIRLLRRHGYLTGELSVRPAAVVSRVVAPKPVATPAPVPAKLTLKDRIATGERSSVLLSGGVNAKTELVTLNDGTKVVRKTARSREGVSARTQQDAEELAAKVITSLGVRAPQTHRASARVLYMEYVDGTVPTTLPRVGGTFKVAGNHYDSDDGRLIGLGDLLTENYDRNSGNWLIGADGRLCAIDHGFAFTTMQDPSRAPVMPNQYFVEHYHKRYPHLKDWADNDLSPQDIMAARQRVQHLRSEFERLGHLDWYDNALARLHAIGQHAKGTRSRLTR